MTNPEITIFSKEEFGRVRTLMIDGQPMFVAIDITNQLGYSNPRKAVRDHCRRGTKRSVSDDQGVPHETHIIPESDVYRLIIKSRLPLAEKFEAWVMEEVLPSIRKHGYYIAKQEEQRLIHRQQARLENPDMMRALKDFRESKDLALRRFDFSNENNLVYLVVFGMTCKKFKETRNLADVSIRDHMTLNEIKTVEYVQNRNTALIELGMSYQDRKNALIDMLERKIESERKRLESSK